MVISSMLTPAPIFARLGLDVGNFFVQLAVLLEFSHCRRQLFLCVTFGYPQDFFHLGRGAQQCFPGSGNLSLQGIDFFRKFIIQRAILLRLAD